MNFTLPDIKRRMDALLNHLTSLYGETIYCVPHEISTERKQTLETNLASKVLSFYDFASMLNEKFPELSQNKEYFLSVKFDVVHGSGDVFRFEGFALSTIEKDERVDVVISQIHGYTNLVESNPNLIH